MQREQREAGDDQGFGKKRACGQAARQATHLDRIGVLKVEPVGLDNTVLTEQLEHQLGVVGVHLHLALQRPRGDDDQGPA